MRYTIAPTKCWHLIVCGTRDEVAARLARYTVAPMSNVHEGQPVTRPIGSTPHRTWCHVRLSDEAMARWAQDSGMRHGPGDLSMWTDEDHTTVNGAPVRHA